MKRSFYFLLILLIPQISIAQELDNRDQTVFKVGEELKYRLRYGFITAAEATLKVASTTIEFNNKPVFHLIASGKTSGSFDFFYKVRNRYDSYVDQKDLLPYFYTESIHESNYRRNDKARFYQDNQKIVSKSGTFKGKEQTFDLVSAYYFARSLDMSNISPGDKFTMYYYLDDGVNDLQIQYIGKEWVKTGMGSFNCLKFSPSIKPGRIFKKDSKLYLWITDDGNRIPVKAQVEILVGSVTMELTDAKNLKYPLTALK